MRKTIIAGNWKMYKTLDEAEELVNSIKRELYKVENSEIVVCPAFTLLAYLSDMLISSNIGLGAQNCHWQDEGAFTGEISCKMLKDAGVKFVIIGHSERRQYFAETNENVSKKLRAALNAGLIPIACVGETLEQREAGKTFDVLTEQLKVGLTGLTAKDLENLIIAYEPVWAIGTGKTATAAQAQEAHKFIRNLLIKLFGNDSANSVRIQYGGSVKPENITELMQEPDIDGALVGGASLTADSFSTIVKKASEVKK